MQQIDPNASPEVVLSRLGVLSIRLKSGPDTRPLARAVDEARRQLRAQLDTWQARSEEAQAATGAVAFADEGEDEEVADLARRAKVEANGEIRSDWYTRLFAVAPSAATRGTADEEQLHYVAGVLEKLATPEYAALAGGRASLEAAHREVLAAKEADFAADRAEAEAWNEVQLAERACREVYRDTEPELMLIFPGRKRKVESFFYRPRKKKTKAAAGTTED